MWAYPPRRILVAIDFGDASARAAQAAGELARVHRATLTALHAETLEAPPYFTDQQVRALERERKAARGDAERYLASYMARHAQIPAECVVVNGAAAPAIVRGARRADLVVMGTHGRRGPARWWAGSVAERVVREVQVPVLVLRADAPAEPDALFRRLTLVAGVGAFDGPARRYAHGLAAQFGGEVSREPATAANAPSLQAATLLVVPQTSKAGPFAASSAVAQLLRTTRRPVLVVPPV